MTRKDVRVKAAPARKRGRALDAWIMVLALCGFSLNLWLLIRHVSGGGIAGCGGGSSCEELLNSRWSQVLGVPVTGLGCLIYLGVMGSATAKGRWLRNPCLGLIGGAAVWFVFVQAVVLGRFCPWCMAAHGIGMTTVALGLWRDGLDDQRGSAARTMGLAAAMAILGISLLQVFGPRPVTHRIDTVHANAAAAEGAVHARGNGRKIAFDDGRKLYDVAALPHLGRTDARRVMVEYFDYSCAACQTMRGFLAALMAKHPDDLAVVLMPVPLDGTCNRSLAAGDVSHPGSCELAKLALAVWRTHPAAFAAFHQRLMEHPVAPAARTEALKLMPQAELDAALRDPWIEELIQADIHDWVTFSATRKNLPKLLISDKRILHGLPSGEADFIRVMEYELGL